VEPRESNLCVHPNESLSTLESTTSLKWLANRANAEKVSGKMGQFWMDSANVFAGDSSDILLVDAEEGPSWFDNAETCVVWPLFPGFSSCAFNLASKTEYTFASSSRYAIPGNCACRSPSTLLNAVRTSLRVQVEVVEG